MFPVVILAHLIYFTIFGFRSVPGASVFVWIDTVNLFYWGGFLLPNTTCGVLWIFPHASDGLMHPFAPSLNWSSCCLYISDPKHLTHSLWERRYLFRLLSGVPDILQKSNHLLLIYCLRAHGLKHEGFVMEGNARSSTAPIDLSPSNPEMESRNTSFLINPFEWG